MHEICPSCGKVSAAESPRFCSECGARIDGGTPIRYMGYFTHPREHKNPLIAGFCSSVLPGLGQVYNGETAKGFFIFLLTLVGLVIFLIPGLIVWLYAMYNAYSVAGKMNTGEISFRETRILHMVLFSVFAVIIIIIVLLIIITIVMAILTSLLGTDNYNGLYGSNGLF